MPTTEWTYEPTDARQLWVLAHLPVAALGGVFLIAGVGLVLLVFSGSPSRELLFLLGLLFLVGGPLSLLYLWPMIADPDQRPTLGATESEQMPYTARSGTTAAVLGFVGILGAAVIGVDPGVIYWIIIASVFSVTAWPVFRTDAVIDDETLRKNGTPVSRSRIDGVRTLPFRGVTLVWLSYVRGTGLFAPRLLVVPEPLSEEVVAMLRSETPVDPVERTDRLAAAVLLLSGLGFVGAGTLAYTTITQDGFFRIYVAGILAAVGVLFCLAGWREV